MEDKKFAELQGNLLSESPVQSAITPFGSSQGFVTTEDEIGNLLGDGGSPVTDAQPLPIVKGETPAPEVPQTPAEPEESLESAADRIFGEDSPIVPEAGAPLTPTETPEDPETPEDNMFQSLAENLLDYGIFSKIEGEDEEPITSGEQLKERWEKEKEIQVNSKIYDFLLSKHGQEGLDVFNSIFVNGANPKDYLAKFDSLQSIKDMDLSQESNQETVFRAYQRRAGWSEEKINKYIDKYKSLGELEETATDLHEELLKHEEADLAEMAEEAELRERQKIQQETAYQQTISTLLQDKLKKGDFDGIPVTQKTAKETFDYLAQKRFRLPSGELLTTFDKDILELRKPENYELKLKIGLLLKDGFDLTKVKAKAVTETKDKFFDKVIRENKQQSKKNTVNINQNPSGFLDGLKYHK